MKTRPGEIGQADLVSVVFALLKATGSQLRISPLNVLNVPIQPNQAVAKDRHYEKLTLMKEGVFLQTSIWDSLKSH